MTQTRRFRGVAAATAVTMLVGTFTVVASGSASAGGGNKNQAICELTLRNNTTMTADFDSAQDGPGDRWTARPTGTLKAGSSAKFSNQDFPPPGMCRIMVSYNFLNLRDNRRIPAMGLVVFDGKEGDAQCNVFGPAFKCTAKKTRDDNTLSVEVVFSS